MYNTARNSLQLREVNGELLRAALRAVPSATKAELADATGLSVATCGKILARMVALGEAQELELGQAEGGRPPRLYRYAPMFYLTALIFPKAAGGRKYMICEIRDAGGGCVERERHETERAGIEEIAALIESLIQRHAGLRAVAIAIPALFNQGVVEHCDLPELLGVAVEDRLRERFHLAINVAHDMGMAALGYHHAHRGVDPVVYLSAPRSNYSGAGVVIGGRLLRGHSSFAGELSFAPLGVDRESQYAGLSPRAALSYAARLAATAIAAYNPATLVVVSEDMTQEYIDKLRVVCSHIIPERHLPAFVPKQTLDEDCLTGLASVAAASISNKLRQVESYLSTL